MYTKNQIQAMYNNVVSQSGVYVEFPSDPVCRSFVSETTRSQCSIYTSDSYTSEPNDFRRFTFKARVAQSGSGHDCVAHRSCVPGMFQSAVAYFSKGFRLYYSYQAQGGDDWYECAIVLMKSPDSTHAARATGLDGTRAPR